MDRVSLYSHVMDATDDEIATLTGSNDHDSVSAARTDALMPGRALRSPAVARTLNAVIPPGFRSLRTPLFASVTTCHFLALSSLVATSIIARIGAGRSDHRDVGTVALDQRATARSQWNSSGTQPVTPPGNQTSASGAPKLHVKTPAFLPQKTAFSAL